MGVYIDGLDMPKHCYECLLRQGNCCLLLYEAIPPTVPLTRLDDCPLIEIDDTVWENEKYKLIRMTQAVRINKAMAERRADEDGDRVVETASDRA